MKLTNSNSCTFCNIYIETIEHLFWECINVRKFWRQLEAKFYESCGYNFEIKWVNDVWFGKLGATPVLNLEILCGKYYIYLCKIRLNVGVIWMKLRWRKGVLWCFMYQYFLVQYNIHVYRFLVVHMCCTFSLFVSINKNTCAKILKICNVKYETSIFNLWKCKVIWQLTWTPSQLDNIYSLSMQ